MYAGQPLRMSSRGIPARSRNNSPNGVGCSHSSLDPRRGPFFTVGVLPAKVTEPKRIAASWEGIQLCITNGDRLVRDSERVSEPTQAALLELAIEELAKGWMMFFSLAPKGSGTGPAPGLASMIGDFTNKLEKSPPSPAEIAAVVEFFKQYGDELSNPPLEDAFERHAVKLSFLEAVVRFLIVIAPFAAAVGPTQEMVDRSISPAYKSPKSISPEKFAEFSGELGKFRLEKLGDFRLLKEHGFYVDALDDAGFVTPGARVFANRPLEALAEKLSVGLKIACSFTRP